MSQQSLSEWDKSRNSETVETPQCLSLTIRGPWGHFRRIEGNIVKQTYRIIPRTTVAGLLAAVLGIERDGYYDLFAPGNSAVAIEPVEPLRTVNMPVNTLSTAAESMKSLNSRGKISIKLPDPTKPRQQHNYEVLVDPAYRLYVWLSDSDQFDALHHTLSQGKSQYVPSLGLSEYLADIRYHGQFAVEDDPTTDVVAVDSAVPNAVDRVIPDTETRCQIEESPAFMQADGSGRTTTGFTSYAYNPDAGPVHVRDPDTNIVDGRTVMFV
ncbi:type I-B CRISPR-associated protein Cas5b [Haloferax larsenii]|uniref:CRISPR-associated protein Cas5h n=1 Tax=Haloferax larsenii TaxID=302484 RepID=A0A1H7Q3R7_HALLR|nr:type I-B CRISPR-associated protein Cas5b [Haloferax larsenii]SEL42653.1 CRISPR-associated protein Cas5h [Haloferax larsenii]